MTGGRGFRRPDRCVARIPDTAVAVTYNLVVDTVGSGFYVYANIYWPGNASINWTANRHHAVERQASIGFLDAPGQIEVYVGTMQPIGPLRHRHHRGLLP